MQDEHQDGGLQQRQQGGVEGHAQAFGELLEQLRVLEFRRVASVIQGEGDPDHGADEAQGRDEPHDIA